MIENWGILYTINFSLLLSSVFAKTLNTHIHSVKIGHYRNIQNFSEQTHLQHGDIKILRHENL